MFPVFLSSVKMRPNLTFTVNGFSSSSSTKGAEISKNTRTEWAAHSAVQIPHPTAHGQLAQTKAHLLWAG